MKLLHQEWEKRNIGLNCYELEFNNKDQDCNQDSSKLLEAIDDIDYAVAKVPSGKMKIAYSLQEQGFKFAENQISLVIRNLDKYKVPEFFIKYVPYIQGKRLEGLDLDQIYTAIQQNGIFDTDRISLDPCMSVALAGQRYRNWVEQEIINKTGEAHLVLYKSKNIGFSIIKKENETSYNSLLAGLFDKQKYGGLGFSVLYVPIIVAQQKGAKLIHATVSSNNLPSLKIHLALGYEIEDMTYVYIKHFKNN